MSVKYSWKIHALNYNTAGLSGAVSSVEWIYTATEKVNETPFTADERGTLELPSAAEDDFTEYSDLTEEQIISWVETLIGEEEIANKQFRLSSIIDAQKSASTTEKYDTLPWESQEVVDVETVEE
jgi:hypothetical protein